MSVYHQIVVIVTEKPVIKHAFILDHLQKPRQAIRPVVGAEPRDNTVGSAMSEDAVHFPICFTQAVERRLIS
ncbi:hypothetical protein SDC9_67816 [bioreactor metagenome]|uniref:Uncharacterized protein n=1 Tax=bioreactor metagenome TaxID=1076179 RepID=A0A644XYL9_9ZZZZ